MARRALVFLAVVTALAVAPAADAARVFSVAGNGNRNDPASSGAATDAGGYFYGVAAMRDGGFLVVTDNGTVVRRVGPDGRIARVAGTGDYGVSGDGGKATRTALYGVGDIAPLPTGGFLLSEGAPPGSSDYRVRRVDTSGVITTIAHVRAGALALLPDGGFLAATGLDDRVLRVDARGAVTTVAGIGPDRTGTGVTRKVVDGVPATSAQLNDPHALAVLPDGGFLIAEEGRVRRVDKRGIITTVAGGGKWRLGDRRKATDVALRPGGLAVLPEGGFLVVDTANARVRRIDTRGTITTLAGGSQTVQIGRVIFSPYPIEARWSGLTFDLGGALTSARMYVSDLSLRPDGSVLVSGRTHVLVLATGRRPPLAVALRRPIVRAGIVRLRVAASRAGNVRIEVRAASSGRRVVVVSRRIGASVSTAALPRLPQGAYEVRVTLRAGTAIATDRTAIFSGATLPLSLARAAVAAHCCDGGPAVALGRRALSAQETPEPALTVIQCRRFGPARVDCASGSERYGCQAPYSVTLRGVLVHIAEYICHGRRKPFLVKKPSPIAPPIPAPLL